MEAAKLEKSDGGVIYLNRAIQEDVDATVLKELVNLYRGRIGVPTTDDQRGLAQYYIELTSRGLPAKDWLTLAINTVGAKAAHKRNFGYLVGMIRRWMVHGIHLNRIPEDDQIVDIFEEVTGQKVSPEARAMLQYMMGQIGTVQLTKQIMEMKVLGDPSFFTALALKTTIERNNS